MSHQYHLVINNPTYEDDERIIRYLDNRYDKDFKDSRIVMETAPSTGTEHYHIYIRYKQKKSFMYIKERFPRAHIDVYTGDVKQIDDYLDKEELEKSEEKAMLSWSNTIKIK